MPSTTYSRLPHEPSIKIEPYTVSIPEQDVQDLKTLLKHTRIPKETFENRKVHREDYGITREWFIEAKDAWLGFDWRKVENRINGQANFLAEVKNDEGETQTIHFMALFSERKDATPIVFCNGWPSCFMEYLPLFEHVSSQYSPKDLPYHLIVPSLPGYAFSSNPPLDIDFGFEDLVKCYSALIKGLGFNEYIAQGSDLGSFVVDGLANVDQGCKATHSTNPFILSPPEGTPEYEQAKEMSASEVKKGTMKSLQMFGYALEQGTKPATIGMAIGCNPMSLFAWNGEKIKAVSHPKLDMDTILAFVSLWWFTDTYPSSIYAYRQLFGPKAGGDRPRSKKPFGYSLLPYEPRTAPVHWVEKEYNLVWSKAHKDGGHFPFLEHPVESWGNFEEFIKVIENQVKNPERTSPAASKSHI